MLHANICNGQGHLHHKHCNAAARRCPLLQVECAKQRLPRQGAATRALTDLSGPPLDWVALAAGMGVPASRADTAEAFAQQLAAALQAPGPHLIHAVLR